MVTAATQKRQRKTKAAEEAKAEEFIAEAVADAKKNGKRKRGEWPCTAEDIIAERDHKGQSWKQVAINLDLGSPGQARKAYSELTGVPHDQSQPLVHRTRSTGAGRKKNHPQWDDDSDQDAITDALNGPWIEAKGSGKDYVPAHWRGSVITVSRTVGNGTFDEEVVVKYVTEFTFGKEGDQPLQVWLVQDNGASRCFRVADITEVR